jgi:hypothetical protein
LPIISWHTWFPTSTVVGFVLGLASLDCRPNSSPSTSRNCSYPAEFPEPVKPWIRRTKGLDEDEDEDEDEDDETLAFDDDI